MAEVPFFSFFGGSPGGGAEKEKRTRPIYIIKYINLTIGTQQTAPTNIQQNN